MIKTHRFITLARILNAVVNNPVKSWEEKYEFCFGEKPIIKAFRELGIPFSWCDPDTSYQEDVEAFNEGIQETAGILLSKEYGQPSNKISIKLEVGSGFYCVDFAEYHENHAACRFNVGHTTRCLLGFEGCEFVDDIGITRSPECLEAEKNRTIFFGE